MYKIKLTKIATENLNKIDRNTRNLIIKKIESLMKEPKLLGKPLKGPLRELRSIRAAGQRYRIIYKVFDEDIVVIVIAVGIRKEGDKKDIYELLKKYIKTGLIDNE